MTAARSPSPFAQSSSSSDDLASAPQSSSPASPQKAASSYQSIAAKSAIPANDGPRNVDSLPVAFDVAYTWDYATKRTELRVLYEKSKDLMWNAQSALAWDTKVDPEAENMPDFTSPLFGTPIWDKLDEKREIPRLRREMAAYLISNFLHGEQGALLATSQILATSPTPEAKLYAAAQVYDEARHVEAYDRYLREKYETVYPCSPHLRELLDTILTDSRWDFKFLGMQLMVEGVALGAFGTIQSMATEPLIKQITAMIMQDEARHVAFGVLTLKDTYVAMPENEKRDREDFVIHASRLLRDRFLGQEVWERLGLPKKECEAAVESSELMSVFRKLLFSKIVPNVKRLGLLTPRVRRGFEELGVIHFENLEASA